MSQRQTTFQFIIHHVMHVEYGNKALLYIYIYIYIIYIIWHVKNVNT